MDSYVGDSYSGAMAGIDANRTLYVGNLDHAVTEELVVMLFSQLGEVRSCKMFRDPNTDPYCFVEFGDHITAMNAITMMNDKNLNNRKMRVDWATGQGNKNKYTKVDTSRHHHVYVGDLSPEIDEQALKEAFQVFGEISDCKVVKDPQSFKSRGYGFVVFVRKVDAETAIQNMNGTWLGRKMIKTRWATRKPQNEGPEQIRKPEHKRLNYDEVFQQTTPTNTTVFCGGLKQDITEDMLQQSFVPHGQIEKVKIFKEKGYAFIKYQKKEMACEAIVELHNTSLNGQMIRCSWGKDTGADNPSQENNSGPPPPPPQNNGAMTTNNGQSFGNYPGGGNGPAPGYGGNMGGVPNNMGNIPNNMGYWPYYPQQYAAAGQMGYNQYYSGYQPNPGYMWMGWGQQQGWNGPPQGPSGPGAPQGGPPQPQQQQYQA